MAAIGRDQQGIGLARRSIAPNANSIGCCGTIRRQRWHLPKSSRRRMAIALRDGLQCLILQFLVPFGLIDLIAALARVRPGFRGNSAIMGELPGMLDYAKCSMSDVVAFAAQRDAFGLAEELRVVARVHADALLVMRDAAARDAAAGMSADATLMAGELETQGGLSDLSFGQTIIAFSSAARLLGLSRPVQVAIASRGEGN